MGIKGLLIGFFILTTYYLLLTTNTYASHSCGPGYEAAPNGDLYQYCEGHNMWENDNDPPKCSHNPKGSCLSEERCVEISTGKVDCVALTQIPPSPNASITVNLGAPPAGLPDIENVFSKVVSVSVALAFVALVFVLVWAGIRYLTSGGDAKAIQAAALTITWAGLGVLFLVFAWLILLLIKSFTGVDVTIFDLKHFCEGSNIKTILGCP